MKKIEKIVEKIVEKTLKIIGSCAIIRHIQITENYVDLAVRQILKRKTAKNYQ